MPTPTEPKTHLHGRQRTTAQVVWLILVFMMIADFAYGVPLRFNSLTRLVREGELALYPGLPSTTEAVLTSRLGPEEEAALQTIGISLNFYAGYVLAADIALALICTLIGFLIYWRKHDDWMALWVSLIVILLGTHGPSLVVPSIALIRPRWIIVSAFFGLLGMISNVNLLFNSPDGKYVPQWTRHLAIVFTGITMGIGIYAAIFILRSGIFMVSGMLIVLLPIWLVLCGLGILSQIYRYFRVSDRTQRQQAKWVAAGLIPITLGFVTNAILLFAASSNSGLDRVLINLARASLVNLCMVFLPICLAISILRYRLWDIDVIVRKTLGYAVLSGLLGVVYFGGVALLQGLLTADDRLPTTGDQAVSSQPSAVVIVVTTLAIAALANPLRRRVQDFIDRRFYRQKYDAEKALAEFAGVARNETDLKQLSSQLTETAQGTLQPEKIILWLKQ